MPSNVSQLACPVCHAVGDREDRFCVSCGALLPRQVIPPLPSGSVPPTAGKLSQQQNHLFAFMGLFLILPALVWGGYFLLQNLNAHTPISPLAVSTPAASNFVPAAPIPSSVTQLPDTRPRLRDLTPAEVAEAERDLPALLGALWYPGATLNTTHSAYIGRTFREGAPRYRLPYPFISLSPPTEDFKTVCAYYENAAPGGKYLKSGVYVAEKILRPGDGITVRVVVAKPEKGPYAGRILVMLMTLR